MANQHYCLRWNNYQSNMTSVFHHLLRTEAFVDVTLACNTESIKAHKVVLSACSSYFQKILLDNPSQHPTIIMPYDVCFSDLKFIIEFVYRGEIDVSQSELQSLLKTADQLKIKGLCEVPDGCDASDMPSAEVTPLEPPSPSPSPPLHTSSLSRFKIRKLTLQAKKRMAMDSRKRLYRETLQQYKKNSQAQEEEIHIMDEEQESHDESQEDVLQSEENIHHNSQQTQNQSLHQTQQMVDQHTVHQTESSMMQTQHPQHSHLVRQPQHQHLQVASVQGHSDQHDEDSTQQESTELYEAVVTIDDNELDEMASVDALNNCITVATSTDDDVVILDSRVGVGGHLTHADAIMMTSPPPPIMSSHGQHSQQVLLDSSGLNVHSDVESLTAEVAAGQDNSPDPTLLSSPSQEMTVMTSVEGRMSLDSSPVSPQDVKVKFETLRAMDSEIEIDDQQENSHLTQGNCTDESSDHTMHTMMITPELLGLIPSSSASTTQHTETIHTAVKHRDGGGNGTTPVNKTWSQEDMDAALDALRTHSMSLTKASVTYGIPSTTLWQRAHRLGIDTPKKDGPAKSWTEDVLNVALEALRNGSISANKASKAYGIPSSTLYKIARREGIRLTPPFNAVPTTWSSEDLERALEAIRSGQTTVQRAAADYGIPSGTLYGRCKREGIELSRSNPTPWSEDAMTEALDAVRMGQMSINQAAIHYNLPYSSLYGRFKRVKYEADHVETEEVPLTTTTTTTHSLGGGHQIMLVQYQQPATIYQHAPS